MPEMHSKQPGSTYSACGPFTKNKERTQKFKETGDSRYIIKYYVIKHLILLKMQNMTDPKEFLLLWFIDFLIKLRFTCR